MISHVFAKVKQQLETTLRALGQELPIHELGEFHLASTSAPPQIVWVIRGGPVTPARQGSADGVLGVHELARRNERILIHVWAENFGATEILMNHFVAAAREELSGYSFSAKSTDWSVGQDKVANKGRVCILEIEIGIPFTAEPLRHLATTPTPPRSTGRSSRQRQEPHGHHRRRKTEITAPPRTERRSQPCRTASIRSRTGRARKGCCPSSERSRTRATPKRLRPRAKPMLIHNPSFGPYSAAKVVNHWPTGMEMSEADFDKAIADQTAHVNH